MADLWDDTALISAFNSAMAKYKTMHSQQGKGDVLGQAVNAGENDNDILQPVDLAAGSDARVAGDVNDDHSATQIAKKDAGEVFEGTNKTDEVLEQESYADNGALKDDACSQIMLELDLLEQQKRNLQERLAHLGVPHSSYSYPGLASQGGDAPKTSTHTPCLECCSTAPQEASLWYPCEWNARYNSLPAAASFYSSPPPPPPIIRALQCQDCGYAPIADPANVYPDAAHQAMPSYSSAVLTEVVRAAVTEAMKVRAPESQKLNGERECSPSGLADVAVAWFLAGFHTSRFLSAGGNVE